MKPGPKPNPNRMIKKQSTRLIKVMCAACGYTMRITRKWLEVAVPDCPDCGRRMKVFDGSRKRAA